MSFFRRQGGMPKPPKHVEIWGHIVENNLFLRRLAGSAVAFGFLSLAMGAYALKVGLYQPIAFHVDAEGKADYAGRLRGQVGPSDVEVRYVAKAFLKRYLAPNSLTIELDMAEAFNLMTPHLQKEHEETFARFEKENGETLVERVKKQGIQTVLNFEATRTQVSNHNEHAFTVRMHGTSRTWPLNRVGEDAGYDEKQFDALVTLVRCPRTEHTPNGLLVAKVSRRFTVNDPQIVTLGWRYFVFSVQNKSPDPFEVKAVKAWVEGRELKTPFQMLKNSIAPSETVTGAIQLEASRSKKIRIRCTDPV